MKRITSVFLLIVFCMYSFIYKTHCYYYEGTLKQFKGDSGRESKAAYANNKYSFNYFASDYKSCNALKKSKPGGFSHFTVHFFADDMAALPGYNKISCHLIDLISFVPHVSSTRGNPLTAFGLLRAPPFC